MKDRWKRRSLIIKEQKIENTFSLSHMTKRAYKHYCLTIKVIDNTLNIYPLVKRVVLVELLIVKAV